MGNTGDNQQINGLRDKARITTARIRSIAENPTAKILSDEEAAKLYKENNLIKTEKPLVQVSIDKPPVK